MSSLLWILGGTVFLGACAYGCYKWLYSKKENNQQNNNKDPKEKQPEVIKEKELKNNQPEVPKKEEIQPKKTENNENISENEKEKSIKSELLKSQENKSEKLSQIGELLKEEIKKKKLAELLDDKSNFRFELKRGETLVIPEGYLDCLEDTNLIVFCKKQAIFLASKWYDDEPVYLEKLEGKDEKGKKTTYYVFNPFNVNQPIYGGKIKRTSISNNKALLDGKQIFENEGEVDKFNCSLIEHAYKYNSNNPAVQQLNELVRMKEDESYTPNKSILGDRYFEYVTSIGKVVILKDTMRGRKLENSTENYLLKTKIPLYLSFIYGEQNPYLEKLTFKDDEKSQNKECFVLNPYNKPFFGKEGNMMQISVDENYKPYLNNNNNNDKIFNDDGAINNFNCCVMEHIKTNNLGGETFEQLFDNNKQLIKAGIPKNSKNNNDPNINMNNMNSAGQNVNQQ